MKIALTVGHSILKSGAITSADGVKLGGVNEYKYNKRLAPYIKKYLEQLGEKVDVIVCPEKKFTESEEERDYKLNRVNSGKYDLVVELHLNASKSISAEGTEVYYLSEKGKAYAEHVQDKLSTLFDNRGVKARDNLYILTQTEPVAILIESFFCTNKKECRIGSDMDKVAKLIAEGITNNEIKEEPTTIYRVQVGPYNDQNQAIKERTRLKSLGYDAIIVADK